MTTWEGDYMKTIVHMMARLGQDYEVLFVDYPFTYKDFLLSLIGKSTAPSARMIGAKPRLRKLQSKGNTIHHLTLPPVMPTNWMSDFEYYKKSIGQQSSKVAKSINRAMKSLGFENPIVINAFNPLIGLNLVGKLGECKNIYYCYDEIRAALWCGKHGGKMEDLLIAKMDAVITTSSQLQVTKSKQNQNTHLIKNGVDFELFNKAYDRTRFNKSHKVIGYLGSIDFRLDYELLSDTISRFPDHSFHFVGRITDQAGYKKLNQFKNVHFRGALQPEQIPGALRQFDLGLIPFEKNDFTKNIYPLKINEYLAAGIPVVSTDFADLSDFENAAIITKTHQAFVDAIASEIKDDSVEKMEVRIKVAEANDWSSRASKVKCLIEKLTENHA